MASRAETFEERRRESVETIRKAAAMAERMGAGPLIVAFSGGKDSQCVYHLAEEAGAPFEAVMNATSIDPPEVIRFVRRHYPAVKISAPRESFFAICERKGMLPTRLYRFCCAELKEQGGAGRVTLTGVRREESQRRADRQEVSVARGRRFTGYTMDQFTRERRVEAECRGGGSERIIVNPILEWTEADVWRYLNDVVQAPHCGLYDRRRRRVGCLFCPMSTTRNMLRDAKEYPHMWERLKRTAAKICENNPYFKGRPAEYLEWWMSKKNVAEWDVPRLPLGEVDSEVDMSCDGERPFAVGEF